MHPGSRVPAGEPAKPQVRRVQPRHLAVAAGQQRGALHRSPPPGCHVPGEHQLILVSDWLRPFMLVSHWSYSRWLPGEWGLPCPRRPRLVSTFPPSPASTSRAGTQTLRPDRAVRSVLSDNTYVYQFFLNEFTLKPFCRKLSCQLGKFSMVESTS